MTQIRAPIPSSSLPISNRPRIRDLGYSPGKFTPGPKNSILDVPGVHVGQITVHEGTDIHTGLTVILPRGAKDTRLKPCYAATHDLNGMGELTGSHALAEYGYINIPIAITNTVSVGKVYDGLFLWDMEQARKNGEDDIESLRRFSIPVVGETYDGLLNDISASVLDKASVYDAIAAAQTQTEVLEGNYGGGTAMRCHGYKGGTGTSSRVVPGAERDYTLGVLVQANHGQKPDLRIGNVPVGELLMAEEAESRGETAKADKGLPVGGKAAEGSQTDAPLLPHQLRRLAQHAGMGITQVGGHSAGRNFSGEISLALSTGTSPDQLATSSDGFGYLPPLESQPVETLKNETIDSLFYAVSETTEEAILNAMCKAETLVGFKGRTTTALPVDRVQELLKKYGVGLRK
ncbi:DmpA/ArgJ-like protein [Trichoderma citrinoviride]|uniref:DmpA/ArgJ-like protein n=1 Tax=Trichoderma citrinoviride TaxID=58853 RepID=A0A2T4B0N1_9HYPO|nr:DmpA/ArgJ-like protein [Trichoderma citrinoviride]PTB62788.1 DmpA/ArgJ-like protein [Trichoderma citrinoviride]